MTLILHHSKSSDGLLCPNATTDPINPFHAQRNRMLDAVSDAMPKDGNGDHPPEHDEVYTALAYTKTSDYMSLYHHVTGMVLDGWSGESGPPVTVSTWWWKCHTCGLVLPATNVARYPEVAP